MAENRNAANSTDRANGTQTNGKDNIKILYDSHESEKLREWIENKKQYLKKIENKSSRQYMQRDVLFFENEVLPYLLITSTLTCSEIAKWYVRCIDEAINRNCNGIVAYLHLKYEYDKHPIVAIVNPKDHLPFGTPGAMSIICPSLEVFHYGDFYGSPENVKCLPMPINISL